MSKARDLSDIAGSNAFTAADETKLDGIETSADVTDATNVTAAGALMDSEVTNLAQVKAFDSADYATAAQGTTADAALPKAGGTMTGAITFAAGQTFDGRDVSADGSKLDGIESGATADQTASEILTAIKTVDGSGSGLDADTLDGQQGSYYYAASNPSGYTTFTANQSLNTTSSPTFASPNLTSALRMGGTQVLSSGRALTNITSVDSTTAAAIGNAGVGGGISLLQTTTISGNPSYIEYNFASGYERFLIVAHRLAVNGTTSYSYGELRMRYKDSGGSVITTAGEYLGSEYYTSGGYSTTSHNVGLCGLDVGGSTTNYTQSISIIINNPRRSDITTTHEASSTGFIFITSGAGTGNYPVQVGGKIATPQDNTGVRFHLEGTPHQTFANMGKMLFFGMK